METSQFPGNQTQCYIGKILLWCDSDQNFRCLFLGVCSTEMSSDEQGV